LKSLNLQQSKYQLDFSFCLRKSTTDVHFQAYVILVRLEKRFRFLETRLYLQT